MATIKLIKEPAPILHQPAERVREISSDIRHLIDSMIQTMHAARGVGLAANQVDSPWSVLVASDNGVPGKELVLINPVLLKQSGRHTAAEGCLSLPGIACEVTRAARVTVQGWDREGRTVTIEAENLLAKILQHEIDHLAGRLFVDRLGVLKRRKLLKEYRNLQKALGQIEV
ncbi:MAG: peptide deformylase [Candidatus Omnitrophica bacterium]|nr:peptide deformylase [Candidatus Omnitrophota bacterium]